MSEPTKQVSRVSAGSIKWTVGWITTDFVKKKDITTVVECPLAT